MIVVYFIHKLNIKIPFFLGNGSYIYIETSHPRKYNEKARLNSPRMRGAQQMTFFYSMYGSTVESLSVYVKINGSEERIWSRYGNQLSSNWTKGCVAITYQETYQVETFCGYFFRLLKNWCACKTLAVRNLQWASKFHIGHWRNSLF